MLSFLNFRFSFRRARVYKIFVIALAVLLAGCASNAEPGKESNATQTQNQQASESHPGKFIWVDLLTPDVDSAKAFYGGLFGWTFVQQDKNTLVLNRGVPIASLIAHAATDDGMPEALWVTAMAVQDLNASLDYVRAAGGRVLNGPAYIKQRGYAALIRDPKGADLLLLRSDKGDTPDIEPEMGDWIWNELWTDDAEKSIAFYEPLGEYQTQKSADGYQILTRQERWRAGVRSVAEDQYRSRWVPAVRVVNPEGLLDKVEALGGFVLLRPDEPPSNGDMALIVGPDGALLMLQRWIVSDMEEGQK